MVLFPQLIDRLCFSCKIEDKVVPFPFFADFISHLAAALIKHLFDLSTLLCNAGRDFIESLLTGIITEHSIQDVHSLIEVTAFLFFHLMLLISYSRHSWP